jgi:hypothetical protein
MFCATGLVFDDTEGVGCRFHVLRARTRFRRYRRLRVPFSCFARPDSFSAVPRASDPVFMFGVPGLVFDDIEGVGSRFQVLHARTHFRRYRGRRVLFSCFALPDLFSTVPRASGPVFMFCAPGLVFDGTEGVMSRFHVLRSRIRFRRNRGRRVPFSCFARPDSYSAVLRASGPDLMFCAPELIFGGNEGIVTRFHIFRARTRFHIFRARPFSFSAVPRAFGPVIMFCSPRLIFGGTGGVGSRLNVLGVRTCFLWYRGRRVPFSCFARPNTFSAVPRASSLVFMFTAPGLVFDYTDDVGSRFYALRARTHFRRYRGSRVSFSCFPLPDSFSTIPMTSGPVFMFCAPGLIFGGNEGVGSRFHVLRARTRIRRYGGRRVPI